MDGNDNKPEVDDNKSDNQGWSTEIRPRWKKGYSRGRSYAQQHDTQPTGISNQVISANKLKNPSWDRESTQWVEGITPPKYEKEPNYQFPTTTEIRGRVKDDFFLSRTISKSKLPPWQKVYVGDPNKSRAYYTRHLLPGNGRGGRRRTHKRKNKHTRRRVQRRRRA